jgi:GNAT superfamily N-acetyltransferase
MPPSFDIEPVPAEKVRQGLEFLVAGGDCDVFASDRAQSLLRHLQGREKCRFWFWWARVGGQAAAAALVAENPGKVGMLLHSPPSGRGVNFSALAATVRAAAEEALGRGMTFVQALIDPRETRSIAAVNEAGFTILADLLHMQRRDRPTLDEENPHFHWLNFTQFSHDELAALIVETYRGSLDCPQLGALRGADDVIACHQSSGVFCPRSWLILRHDGKDAGCVLMNESSSDKSSEIVYLGVAPQHRGKGLGKSLLRRALACAHQRRMERVVLAVDDRNVYAKRIYEAEGFSFSHRRLAYILVNPHSNHISPQGL